MGSGQWAVRAVCVVAPRSAVVPSLSRWRTCINSAPHFLGVAVRILPLAALYEVVTGIKRGRSHGGKQASGMLLTSRAFVCNVRGRFRRRPIAGLLARSGRNTDEKRATTQIGFGSERAMDGWPGASLPGWAGFPRKLVFLHSGLAASAIRV